MSKMRCRECMYFNMCINSAGNGWEEYGGKKNICGLHGCEEIDPDGNQRNLNHKGGCGFWPKVRRVQPVQLTIDFGF